MQTIGGNGEGFTSRYNQQDLDMLSVLAKDKNFVIRWPGGSDAKNAYPDPLVPGLGMREDRINAFYDEFGKDENLDGRDGDLQKLVSDQADDQSQLIDVVNMCQQIPKLKIIYCLNIFAEPSVNINAIQYLINNGVNVVGVVAGNELYFTLSFDGDRYVELFTPHLEACRNSFIGIPRAVCFGQDVFRSTHEKFNSAVIDYIRLNPGMIQAVDTHPYLGADDLNAALIMHPAYSELKGTPAGLIYSNEKNTALEAAFNKYNELWSQTTFYNDCFNYIKAELPDCKIWVSEFGCIPVEYWGNTLSNGAYYFSKFLLHGNDIEYFMMQNLQGSFFWAAMFNHVPHVQYYVLQLLQELGTNTSEVNLIHAGSSVDVSAEGDFYFPFINLGETFMQELTTSPAYEFTGVELHMVDAAYNYSTEGAAGFYAKKIDRVDQVIPNDIGGITIVNNITPSAIAILQNSFGYIKASLKKRVINGCTDPKASNYNPAATDDDGSCVYPPPPSIKGCTDPKATNYNPAATENDGSCIYPAPVVYGCTDPKAKNYNPRATCDDGSCKFKKRFVWWNPSSWFGTVKINPTNEQ